MTGPIASRLKPLLHEEVPLLKQAQDDGQSYGSKALTLFLLLTT